ncbi:hypothetical protein BT96DRAFT_919738 [Gymnopus androsaceus JB14]|uniref:Uncharacterized protein n=1 Tax=Gymnopus androsaceus JB14 TaxID=1447944 RepID=A0A6A4HSF7_9AGAR|nr:hypothetical protein BT96DRAFT_919738 [Gymnopus androsaceus JB14]
MTRQQLARSLTRLRLEQLSGSNATVKDLSSQLITDSVETRLSQEIESRLLSISEFLSVGSVASDNGNATSNLPDQIHRVLEDIVSLEADLSSSWSSAADLITRIEQLHTRLQSDLLDAISTIPSTLNEKRMANDALSAATIEASLVKLSLLRAQSHQKLYGFASGTNPDSATMTSALSIAYAKLKDEARDLVEEEKALDLQIEEYDGLMRLVDGGGFGQIVEDYIRVEKETEECRRDLRRLGWADD